MRFLSLFFLAASAVTAQSLTTTFAGGNGQSGNMFDIVGTQSVVINSFDLNVAAGTWNIDVYRVTAGTTFIGNEANPAAWTLVGTATGVVGLGNGIPTPLPLAINTSVAQGQTQGFYVTISNGGILTYTNGTTLGAVYVQDAFIQFLEGKGIAHPFGAQFSPRIWNGVIHYTPTGGGTFATNTSLGAGCGQTFASFYESFANTAAFDLANTTVTWLNTGTGYTVLNAIPGTFVPPSATATNLCVGLLDGEQAVTLSSPMPVLGGVTSTLQVCTKGYIATAPGNGIDFTPSAAELLAFPQTTWACWHDFNQTAVGSGLLMYEEVAGVAYVTWNGVYSYPAVATPSTVQWQFDLATGNVTLVIGAFGNGSVDPVVVGFSPGGPSPNPGAVDISATPVIVLATPESTGLALAGASRPVIGTNWNLSLTNVPASGVIGVDVFGLVDPGINDLSFLGAPGCGLRSSLDVLLGWLVAGNSHGYSLAVPNNPSLVNVHVYTTSAVFGNPPPNAFGAITANGIDGKIGNI